MLQSYIFWHARYVIYKPPTFKRNQKILVSPFPVGFPYWIRRTYAMGHDNVKQNAKKSALEECWRYASFKKHFVYPCSLPVKFFFYPAMFPCKLICPKCCMLDYKKMNHNIFTSELSINALHLGMYLWIQEVPVKGQSSANNSFLSLDRNFRLKFRGHSDE